MKNYLKFNLKRIRLYIYIIENHTALLLSLFFIIGIIFFKSLLLLVFILCCCFIIFKFKNLVFIFLAAFLGFLYSHTWENTMVKEIQVIERIQEIGYIAEEPREAEFSKQIVVKTEKFQSLVLVKYSSDISLSYGDKVEVQGKLQNIENYSKEESYVNYLKSKNVFLFIDKANVRFLAKNTNLTSIFSSIRSYFNEQLEENLNQPAYGFISALTLGLRGNLSKELNEKFSITGVTHVISTSGMHVLLIYALVYSLRYFIGAKNARILSAIVIIFYLLLLGFYNLPALRSVIMLLLIILSQSIGRRINKFFAVIFSLFVILLIFPFYWQNISLQLSVLATIGLLWFSKPLQKSLNKTFLPKYVSEVFATTIAALLPTLPLIVSTFGTFSIIGFIANLVILPFIDVLILLTILALILNLDSIQNVLFICIESICSFLFKIVDLFSQVPFATTSNLLIIGFFVFGSILLIIISDFNKLNNKNEKIS